MRASSRVVATGTRRDLRLQEVLVHNKVHWLGLGLLVVLQERSDIRYTRFARVFLWFIRRGLT